MKLKKLGKGYPSKTGNMVVPIKNLPRIGDEVVNSKMQKVGYVYDIIGPVKSPFAVVRLENKNDIEKFVFDELFVVVGYGGDRKGKGSRKGERKGERSRKKRSRKRRYT
jgi:RNA-binding protein